MAKTIIDFIFSTNVYLQGEIIPHRFFESLIIKKDFLNFRFPVMILTLNLSSMHLYNLLKDIDITNPIVDVRIEVFYKDKDNEDDIGRLFLNKEYMGIIDKSYTTYDPFVNGEFEEKGISQTQQNEQNVRLALYKENDINSFQYGYINSIIKNFSVADAIAYGFKETTNGDMSLVLSPPDNENVYEQDLIVPMGFYQYIEYIDNEMGIYDTPYNIFIDDSIVYILNHNGEHKIEMNREDEFSKPITINTIAINEEQKYNGIKLGEKKEYFVLEENDLKNKLKLDKFGDISVFTSSIDGTVNEQNYTGIHTVKIKSNRFNTHLKKKFDKESFNIHIDNLPFKARPYTDILLRGKRFNNKYRVVGYMTVIYRNKSLTNLELLRTSG